MALSIHILCREAWVELVCDHGYGSGEENVTTTGDTDVQLLYVCHIVLF